MDDKNCKEKQESPLSTLPETLGQLITRACHIFNIFVENFSHEAKSGEDYKASKYTSSTVDQWNHHGISKEGNKKHFIKNSKILQGQSKQIYSMIIYWLKFSQTRASGFIPGEFLKGCKETAPYLKHLFVTAPSISVKCHTQTYLRFTIEK